MSDSEQDSPSAVHVGDGFDPSKHLMKVRGGQEYLEVKWRLVWLRQRAPGARIDTNLLEHHPGKLAVVKAVVTLPDGASASGLGSETSGDFGDYLEKAETKAIGRALAGLGFGTQFTNDYDLEQHPGESGNQRLADSPVEFASTRGRRMPTQTPAPQQQGRSGPGASEKGQAPPPNNGTPPGQPALPGATAIDADWITLIADVRDPNGLKALHAELAKANPSRAVWDAYGAKARAINATT